jgi:hypothetical protein
MERKSILVAPSKGLCSAWSYHAVLLLQNRQENNRRKMVKGTCLAGPQIKVGLLESLVLDVLKKWLWYSIT